MVRSLLLTFALSRVLLQQKSPLGARLKAQDCAQISVRRRPARCECVGAGGDVFLKRKEDLAAH